MSGRNATLRAAGILKRAAVALLAVSLCTGATCTIQISGDGDFSGTFTTNSYVPLDQADAVITITQAADEEQADVEAWFTNRFGFSIRLQDGQDVSINGESLTGPGGDGSYRGSVSVANEYTVTVSEPERGVLETTISAPSDFQITSPSAGGPASLSGFTVTWSDADANLDVTITLSQTLFGRTTTREFGPAADTGTQTFDHEDLADFRQGTDLLITVSRTGEQEGLSGFRSGVVSMQHSETVTAMPAP